MEHAWVELLSEVAWLSMWFALLMLQHRRFFWLIYIAMLCLYCVYWYFTPREYHWIHLVEPWLRLLPEPMFVFVAGVIIIGFYVVAKQHLFPRIDTASPAL
jgi:hypothetical protein